MMMIIKALQKVQAFAGCKMFVQSAAAYAERKRKKNFHCVVVMVVESPSLGMFFFRIVGLG